MSTPKAPKVHIVKPVYTMASVDGSTAELTMYGDIYESQPVDWWGDPIEGQFITLSEFLEDLKSVEGCKDLTIRMNSYGGDAMVANTIHNRLREMARNGTELTCIVDGVAMSGGSLIMCACDTVRANPSSLIMIHKCWSFLWGGYNADELREQAESMDVWDKAQVSIYQRKTGMSETKLLHMMGETTYMTGREAMDKGFVDELIEDAEPVGVAASADGRSLYVRGRQMHLAPGQFAPDNIPTVNPEAIAPVETNKNQPEVTGTKGEIPMTTKELRDQYPEQVAQVEAEALATADHTEAVNAAVQAERNRLAAIDEVAGLFPTDLVQEAKYGENPCTAAELALKAAQKAAKAGSKFLADAKADTADSGTDKVGAAPAGEEEDKPMTDADMMAAGERMAKQLRGEKGEE